MMFSNPQSVYRRDIERSNQFSHKLIQLVMAEMPHFDRQTAAHAAKHVDADPCISEVPRAAGTKNNDPSAITSAWLGTQPIEELDQIVARGWSVKRAKTLMT